MMLIRDTEIEKQSLSTMYFGDDASSDFKLGYILGSKWTQRQIRPMFVLFGDYCRSHCAFIMAKTRRGMPVISKTTEELFELFIEEQTKK